MLPCTAVNILPLLEFASRLTSFRIQLERDQDRHRHTDKSSAASLLALLSSTPCLQILIMRVYVNFNFTFEGVLVHAHLPALEVLDIQVSLSNRFARDEGLAMVLGRLNMPNLKTYYFLAVLVDEGVRKLTAVQFLHNFIPKSVSNTNKLGIVTIRQVDEDLPLSQIIRHLRNLQHLVVSAPTVPISINPGGVIT